MATAAQCAEHLLLKPRRFHELLEQGILTRQARGAYDLADVRRQYLSHLLEVAEARGSDAPDLSQARAQLASAQADGQTMKNASMRESLMAREDVRTAVATSFDRVRAKIAALPAALAPQVVGQRSVAEVRQVLEGGVWQALSELAATKVAGSPRGLG